MFSAPVVVQPKAKVPTAVLLFAVVLLLKAPLPTATLQSPVVFNSKAAP